MPGETDMTRDRRLGWRWGRLAGIAVMVVAGVALLPSLGSAQELYRNKTIVLLVGGTAGSGFDTVLRVMSNHLGRHIPGTPSLTVRDMPGGAGIVVANHIYNTAPKDGLTLAYIGPVVTQPLLNPGDKRIQFVATSLTWIASLSVTHTVLFAWHRTPFNSVHDIFHREMVVGGTNAAANSDVYPKVLNALLGTRFRLMSGFQTITETLDAIEDGEVDGRFTSWDSMQTSVADWLRDGRARILLQASTKRHPNLKGVPTARELAKTDSQRQALDFLFLPAEMGRPIAAPPGVPAPQIAALRNGFSSLVEDPAFLADAKKAGLDVNEPMTGAEIETLVKRIYATPQAVVDEVIKAMQ